ncbi:MAG: hypothetical protein C5B49_09040 [Bdellovibrio sp.]|nr:MAG: hypothetical protein C5B49_09040 [Bdellovibrio sp.]
MGDKRTLAAIDIGSNAIRMIIAEVAESSGQVKFVPVRKYRMPIRLGNDVFESGKISGKNLKASVQAFMKFSQLSKKHGVQSLQAVGTSALREAKNQIHFVELMRRKSGIQIEIIDGTKEAELIHQAVSRQVRIDNARALLVDVGGGSVELTVSQEGKIERSQSFPFGTVRSLKLMKKRNFHEEHMNLIIGDFIRPLSQFLWNGTSPRVDFAIGTGGNLETLGKLKPVLLDKGSRTEMTDVELENLIRKLQQVSLKDRVQRLGLRPDRADVIIPASLVVQVVLRQASIHRLVIPYVGLKDGILWSMLEQTGKFVGSPPSNGPASPSGSAKGSSLSANKVNTANAVNPSGAIKPTRACPESYASLRC